MILFWLSWLFMPKEKIALNDFPRIIAAAFFGVAFNMLTFFKVGLLPYLSASVIMVTTPMIVLILSAIILKNACANAWSRYYLRTNGHGISYIIR
jgi:preprotein translocase subunit SecY